MRARKSEFERTVSNSMLAWPSFTQHRPFCYSYRSHYPPSPASLFPPPPTPHVWRATQVGRLPKSPPALQELLLQRSARYLDPLKTQDHQSWTILPHRSHQTQVLTMVNQNSDISSQLKFAGDLRDRLHLRGVHLDLGQRAPLPPQLLHLLTDLRYAKS